MKTDYNDFTRNQTVEVVRVTATGPQYTVADMLKYVEEAMEKVPEQYRSTAVLDEPYDRSEYWTISYFIPESDEDYERRYNEWKSTVELSKLHNAKVAYARLRARQASDATLRVELEALLTANNIELE